MVSYGGDPLCWQVLGPVRLLAGGAEVDLGPDKQRCFVVALLMTPGQPIPATRLIDSVWGDRPPRSRNALAPYATRVRHIIDGSAPGRSAMLRHVDGGYLLDCDPQSVDLHRVRRLARRARTEKDAACAVDLLEQALTGWHPEALAGVPGEWAGRIRQALSRERLDVLAAWARSAVRLGRHDDVTETIGPLVAEHPTAEALVAPMLLALVATDRCAAALECYERSRAAIAAELGSRPSPALQALHLRILRDEPTASAATGVGVGATTARVVPSHLPADVAGFTARDAELAALDRAADAIDVRVPHGPDATAMTVCTIAGTAGVGKTALAVHWAHRVRHRFPDGQLYLNLRGFDVVADPMPTGEAVRRLLDAVGVPVANVPADPATQITLLRSLLADRRVLILLDNAYNSDQVRPLLPAGAGCLVLATSRNGLTGLVATHGARTVDLDVLTDAEARALLTRRLGAARVAGEPQIVDRLIVAGDRLPLALVIIAARASTRPRLPLAVLLTELDDAGRRLDVLTGGDAFTDVRTVFSWSYRALTSEAARLFRRLGDQWGPDLAITTAASLLGVDPDRAQALVDELADAHLLVEHLPRRYTMHDLLRTYAAELSVADPVDERHAARRRLLDHYLHTGRTAVGLLTAGTEVPVPPDPSPGTTPEPLTDRAAALAWFTAEHVAILAAVRHAHAAGLDAHVWHLAWTVDDLLDLQGHWDDWLHVQHAALTSARRLGDATMQAYSERRLGRGYAQSGRLDDAEAHYGRALELYRGLGDLVGQASTHFSRAWLRELQDRGQDALAETCRSLDLYRAAGHPVGEARALNALGWDLARLGEFRAALAHCADALTLNRELGDRYGEAATWDTLGYIHHNLGDHEEALTCFTHSLDLYREAGDRYNEADVLTHRGDTHRAAGNVDDARTDWRAASSILDELAHPDADQVRARLVDTGAHM